jgi:hypothetical protein
MAHVSAMHFFKLIRQEMQSTLQRLVVISSVAGASNAAAFVLSTAIGGE